MYKGQIFWPLANLITFIGTLIINYGAGAGLFTKTNVGKVGREYSIEITPASWTFSIWAVIYLWQALWMTYTMYLIIRHNSTTIIFPTSYYISYILSNIFNAVWIFAWCNKDIVTAGIFLILLTSSLYICLFISHVFIADVSAMSVEHPLDDSINEHFNNIPLWLRDNNVISKLYMLVPNGIAFYATWCLVATCLNWGIIFHYDSNWTNTVASLVALLILTICCIVYFVLDFIRFHSYLVLTWSPYIILIFAFSGILNEHGLNNVKKEPTSIMVLLLLMGSVFMFVYKCYDTIRSRYLSNQISQYYGTK